MGSFLLVLLGIIVGVVGLIIVRAVTRAKGPKNRCPWTPCGYPLPDEPLHLTLETTTHYPTFAVEECAGCSNKIQWSRYLGRYTRVKV